MPPDADQYTDAAAAAGIRSPCDMGGALGDKPAAVARAHNESARGGSRADPTT